jgi:hypothetical protein
MFWIVLKPELGLASMSPGCIDLSAINGGKDKFRLSGQAAQLSFIAIQI